jgi:hypothetical protein
MKKTMTLNKLKFIIKPVKKQEIIKKNLLTHNVNKIKFNSKIINDIIYDERKHLVCIFKDYLLWDENADFLKR